MNKVEILKSLNGHVWHLFPSISQDDDWFNYLRIVEKKKLKSFVPHRDHFLTRFSWPIFCIPITFYERAGTRSRPTFRPEPKYPVCSQMPQHLPSAKGLQLIRGSLAPVILWCCPESLPVWPFSLLVARWAEFFTPFPQRSLFVLTEHFQTDIDWD